MKTHILIVISLIIFQLSFGQNADELKNGNTTQRYSIMILAIMFKEAIKEDLIPEYMYPFSKLNKERSKQKTVFKERSIRGDYQL